MRTDRRKALQILTGAALAPFTHSRAFADYQPHDDIRILVGFPPGGPLDIAARVIAPILAERMGAAVQVVNKVGASGNDATREMIRSSPDGRTLLLCGPVNTINATLFEGLDFDFLADIVPVASIASVPLIVEVRPGLAIFSIAELLAHARTADQPLRVAYAGKGTPQHVAIALFQTMTGVRLDLRAYPGSAQALADLLEGRADVMFDPAPSSMPLVASGKLRALATTGRQRSPLLPSLPTVAETVPGFEAGSWFGLAAPRGTADAIVTPLHAAVADALNDVRFKQRLDELGATAMPGSPAQFGRFLADEVRRFADITRTMRSG